MTEFINSVLQNQYVQILLSAIQFVGWGGIAVFIVNTVSAIRKNRKIVKRLDDKLLQKADLKETSAEIKNLKSEIVSLREELQRANEYNKATNDAVAILLLTSRRIDAGSKLDFAVRVKELAKNETVLKAADAVIESAPEDKRLTDEDIEQQQSAASADVTEKLLAELGVGGGK